MANVNMRLIARHAKVSPSTVSVVLNRKPHVAVSDATRQRVLNAAESLRYQQASLARAIKKPLKLVAIAVGDLRVAQETFTSAIFQGIHQHLLAGGYFALLQPAGQYVSETKPDTASVPNQLIALHRSRLIDGIIVDKQYFLNEEVRRMCEGGVPLVVVNGGSVQQIRPGVAVPSVTINDRLAGRMAAKHLIDLGHQRIGLIGRPYAEGPRAYHSGPVLEFKLGCEQALFDAGIAPDSALAIEGDLLDKSVNYRAVERMLQASPPPTAIVAGDDQIAAMVINAIKLHGLRVPEDVAVVGYGNIDSVTRLVEPPLSTVEAPLYENGKQAAELLIKLMEKQPAEEQQIVLEPRLVVRDSSLVSRNR